MPTDLKGPALRQAKIQIRELKSIHPEIHRLAEALSALYLDFRLDEGRDEIFEARE